MSRSVRKIRTAISPRFATSTFEKAGTGAVLCRVVGLADQLTLARIVAVPLVVVLFAWGFPGHDYWATGTFIAALATDWFGGRVARRGNRTSAFGSLLDPIAGKSRGLAGLVILP